MSGGRRDRGRVPSRARRSAAAAAALCAWALGACGREPPPPGWDAAFQKKVSPELPRQWRGWTAEDWVSLAASDVGALRFDALWALGELTPPTTSAAAAVGFALRETDAPDVVFAGLVAAERWRAAAPPEVVAAVEGLLAPDLPRRLRARAATVLPALGAAGLRAAVGRLATDDVIVSDGLRRGLYVRGAEAVPALREATARGTDEEAAQAARVLADLGPRAADAVPELLAALRRAGAARFNAADALVAIGDAALPGLEEAARSPDEDHARLAQDALARLRGR